MHFTFLPLPAYVAWEGWRDATDPRWLGVAWQLAFLLLTFTCVVLHELGHAFMGRRFGIAVPRILLLPIGGMAEFASIPREPRREIAIALAGPAVNFLLLGGLLCFFPFPYHGDFDPDVWRQLAQGLILVNLIMGCLNLVPVFPMDGGRVFRALLVRRLGYLRATFWAATLGKLLAIAGMLLLALHFENYLGAVLFGFIFIAGEVEYRIVLRQEREELRRRELSALYRVSESPSTPLR